MAPTSWSRHAHAPSAAAEARGRGPSTGSACSWARAPRRAALDRDRADREVMRTAAIAALRIWWVAGLHHEPPGYRRARPHVGAATNPLHVAGRIGQHPM